MLGRVDSEVVSVVSCRSDEFRSASWLKPGIARATSGLMEFKSFK